MAQFSNLKTIPIGSLLLLEQEESDPYFKKIASMPERLKELMTSANTGSFARGLAMTARLPVEKATVIALIILKLAVGEVREDKLAGVLATDLQLDGEKSKKMAGEIRRDLLAPIRGELEKYWREQKQNGMEKNNLSAGKIMTSDRSGAMNSPSNVLDLNKDKRPPVPPMTK